MDDNSKGFDSRQKEMEEENEKRWQEFEKWSKTQGNEVQEGVENEFRDIEDAFYVLEDKRYEFEDKMDEIDDKRKDLEDKRKDIEKSLRAERKKQQQELESQKDLIFEEKMRPLEEKAKALDSQLEEKWQQLEALYSKQSVLTQQLEEVQARVRELDKQAEFGLLAVISTALENADELEKSGGMSNFKNFLPQINNEEGDREVPQAPSVAPNTTPTTP
jgi:chromosome segregation ATPase